MWNYEKRLEYPVNIKTPNAKLAQFIMSQYGGPYCSTPSLSLYFLSITNLNEENLNENPQFSRKLFS